MRDWKKFDDDEIITVWKGYLAAEFPNHDNPLYLRPEHYIPGVIRLTPMEIVKLVEELIDRLGIKMRKEEVEQIKGK